MVCFYEHVYLVQRKTFSFIYTRAMKWSMTIFD